MSMNTSIHYPGDRPHALMVVVFLLSGLSKIGSTDAIAGYIWK
ncbi:hypothetical protein QT383_19755 [Stenotrophomonas rhizophila]